MSEDQIREIKDILENEEKLKAVSDSLFEQKDTDKTGFIEEKEFITIVTEFSQTMEIPPPSEGDVKSMIESLDSNNDGKFSKDEFVVFLRLLLQALLDSMESNE